MAGRAAYPRKLNLILYVPNTVPLVQFCLGLWGGLHNDHFDHGRGRCFLPGSDALVLGAPQDLYTQLDAPLRTLHIGSDTFNATVPLLKVAIVLKLMDREISGVFVDGANTVAKLQLVSRYFDQTAE